MKKLSLHGVSHTTRELETHLKKTVVGQNHIMGSLCDSYELFKARLNSPEKPLDTFLFLGPTGTGKTLTAKTFAKWVRPGEYKPVFINCGEYSHGHEIAKLIGAPPGYLGHAEPRTQNEGTPAILSHKNIYQGGTVGIIIFDEIEKANESLRQLLLGVLDNGTVSLGDNSVTSFQNCFVFFTSNVGAREAANARTSIGFQSGSFNIDTDGIAIRALKKLFSPEFLNRINHKVVFAPLSEAVVKKIIELELAKVKDKVFRTHRTFVGFSPSVVKHILTEAYSSEYNAREVVRYIEQNILLLLARVLNSHPAADRYRVLKVSRTRSNFQVSGIDVPSIHEASRILTKTKGASA